MKLVDEHPGHEEAIRQVIVDAFGRNDEARLVDELRKGGDIAISIIAEETGEVCGHVAMSRLKSPPGALALAPVSVLKAKQHQGIGSALVRRAVQRARECGYDIIFVLGDPHYYSRFGFAADEAAIFPSRYAGPHFMIEPRRTKNRTSPRCLRPRLRQSGMTAPGTRLNISAPQQV